VVIKTNESDKAEIKNFSLAANVDLDDMALMISGFF
jgi:hypothetical protein